MAPRDTGGRSLALRTVSPQDRPNDPFPEITLIVFHPCLFPPLAFSSPRCFFSGVSKRGASAESVKAETPTVQVANADPENGLELELPSGAAFPEAPAIENNLQEEGFQGEEGDGGVEEHWDDDSGKPKKSRSFSDFGEANTNKISSKDGGDGDGGKVPVSKEDAAGLNGNEGPDELPVVPDSEREVAVLGGGEEEEVTGDEEQEEGAGKEEEQKEDVVGEEQERKKEEGGGGEGKEQDNEEEGGEGGGEDEEKEDENTGSVEVAEGVAASSTASTVEVAKKQKKDGGDGAEDGNIEEVEGVAASSTPSTSDERQERGEDAAAGGNVDGNADGAADGQVITEPAQGEEEEGAGLEVVVDVKKEVDEVVPAVEPAVDGEIEEDGEKGEEDKTPVEGDAVDETAKESMAGGVSFPNGAVQGSMECATTREGEGADNIANIATWKDVPG